MNEHPEGRSVSTYTHQVHGCRCVGCRAAVSAASRAARSGRNSALLRVQGRRQILALKWIRSNHPDVWAELLGQAYDELGIERRPPGRPVGVGRAALTEAGA